MAQYRVEEVGGEATLETACWRLEAVLSTDEKG
jgi:hypothetical protein